MLNPIEAISVEQIVQGLMLRYLSRSIRQDTFKDLLEHSLERGIDSAGGGKMLQFVPLMQRNRSRIPSKERRNDQGVIELRHYRLPAAKELCRRSLLIHCKIIDDRFHREGYSVFEAVFFGSHYLPQTMLSLDFSRRVEQESHPSAGHPPQHPESPEIFAEFRCDTIDDRLGVQIRRPRNDRLYRAQEFPMGGLPYRLDISSFQLPHYLIEQYKGLLASSPFIFGTKEIAFGDHLQNRTHILRHPAVN